MCISQEKPLHPEHCCVAGIQCHSVLLLDGFVHREPNSTNVHWHLERYLNYYHLCLIYHAMDITLRVEGLPYAYPKASTTKKRVRI